jgi:hypothetical protein
MESLIQIRMEYNPNESLSYTGYSVADFADAQEVAPPSAVFDLGGNGSSTPYTTSLTAIQAKHIEELKAKATIPLNTYAQWKRRIREFLTKKNTELLSFLNVAVPQHPVFGPGDILLRRFSNPQVNSSHPSVRDMIIDASGESPVASIDEALKILTCESPLKNFSAYTQAIFDMYKEAGEAALVAQAALQRKLSKLDKIQGKLTLLFDLDVNEKYDTLMENYEEYLKQIYTDNPIDTEYKDAIECYRRFIVLRDIVGNARLIASHESGSQCIICLEEPVSYALVPCGHTFCGTCMRKHTGPCFLCRTHTKDKLKLYFS